ncbi:nucleotide excision repair endonuclease [Bacillus toyonensis]|uniref:Excinuclease ABC subunit C n=1 Tax=Bacillus toyonensis TaxID=155322 RepID=A0A2B5WAG9_9BACI|nr:excinuclease ABC subunit C [Bacillus toyonensis]MBC2682615.1 nucleotide excision repair endonuclease [Bacillus toyonensis]MCU4770207.1 nucleotide excision repair endonuclease [Bacillus toyonensis]MCU5396831.1 nucleotide excision repair endonuclease [Bacillus toyonensis]MCU5584738.1 nucleotide excision repair endonuclease [Bacillus toyonensis]PEB23400.1 excinuclease ABC subunit C [Bacillus toyonensis]
MSELHFMSLEELDNKLKKSDSGIYLIKDYNDNIVYVGKAFSIKSRVLAHFNSYSNIKEYVHLFNKVAYLIEDSLLKRSLLRITYIMKYKSVLNKEVQKEFPELYTQYIKQTNKKSMLLEIEEAKEKRERQEVILQKIETEKQHQSVLELKKLQNKKTRERGELKNKLVKLVGGKTMFYEIISLLDNRYNYHVLAKVLNVELQTLITIKEHRNNFRIPGNHKRTIKHQDIIYALSGKKNLSNPRLIP